MSAHATRRPALVATAHRILAGLAGGEQGVWRAHASPSFVHHFEVPWLAPGVDGVEQMTARLREALRGVRIENLLTIAEGHHVVLRNRATATIARSGAPLA